MLTDLLSKDKLRESSRANRLIGRYLLSAENGNCETSRNEIDRCGIERITFNATKVGQTEKSGIQFKILLYSKLNIARKKICSGRERWFFFYLLSPNSDNFRPFSTAFGPFTLLRIVRRGITRTSFVRASHYMRVHRSVVESSLVRTWITFAHHARRPPPLGSFVRACFNTPYASREMHDTVYTRVKKKKNVRASSL